VLRLAGGLALVTTGESASIRACERDPLGPEQHIVMSQIEVHPRLLPHRLPVVLAAVHDPACLFHQ